MPASGYANQLAEELPFASVPFLIADVHERPHRVAEVGELVFTA
jgi:hypothetical protein